MRNEAPAASEYPNLPNIDPDLPFDAAPFRFPPEGLFCTPERCSGKTRWPRNGVPGYIPGTEFRGTLTHNQHRNIHRMSNRAHRGAKNQILQSPVSVRAHDQQVSAFFLDQERDGFFGRAIAYECLAGVA